MRNLTKLCDRIFEMGSLDNPESLLDLEKYTYSTAQFKLDTCTRVVL